MKNLMLSTAIFAALGGAAVAQTADTTTRDMFRSAPMAGDVLASDFIGMRVYAASTSDTATGVKGVQDGWDDIGEVKDVVLGQDGSVQAVLLDIGGFLGIGERQVALQMSSIRFVADDATTDAPDDFFLVVNADRAMLESAPGYGADTTAAAEGGLSDTAAAPAAKPAMPREGYAAIPVEQLTAEKLTDAAAYGANDERIGEVSELVLAADGKVSQVVLDVGGFLGIGEKRVALPMSDIEILQAAGSDDVRVYVRHTKEQLESMPEYQS